MPSPTHQRERRVQADVRYFENVESIRASLEEIAVLARFVRKWTPWIVGGAATFWPAFGHLWDAILKAKGSG